MVEKDVMVNLEWAMQNTSEDSYYRLLEKAFESRNVENKWGSTSEGTSIDKRVELFIDFFSLSYGQPFYLRAHNCNKN